MESMILVLTPRECAGLLSGDLSVLVRKRFPKDYVGWVYIYVTRDRKILSFDSISKNGKTYYDGFNDKDFDFHFFTITKSDIKKGWGWFASERNLNGKVIARFWCDKVEEIKWGLPNKLIFPKDMLENACLSGEELYKYLGEKGGYAIHITKVDPFDKPKEISGFYKVGYRKIVNTPNRVKNKNYLDEYLMAVKEYQLTRAPTTYCYIEVDAYPVNDPVNDP